MVRPNGYERSAESADVPRKKMEGMTGGLMREANDRRFKIASRDRAVR